MQLDWSKLTYGFGISKTQHYKSILNHFKLPGVNSASNQITGK